MSPAGDNEASVRRLIDLLPLYVREDIRDEVRQVLVPYIRAGRNDTDIMEYIAAKINLNQIRHGFYKVVSELRRGHSEVESAYEQEFSNC